MANLKVNLESQKARECQEKNSFLSLIRKVGEKTFRNY